MLVFLHESRLPKTQTIGDPEVIYVCTSALRHTHFFHSELNRGPALRKSS